MDNSSLIMARKPPHFQDVREAEGGTQATPETKSEQIRDFSTIVGDYRSLV